MSTPKKKVSVDFSGVTLSWKDEPPTEKQIDTAYKYVPRRVVDRWLSENRTRGFFSMVLDYVFQNNIRPEEALFVNWFEIERWYDAEGGE